ncbi:hypothetical protein C3B54_111156 [Pontimonas salivibrio]|uniref:Uncharacterized protein n=2 Tax=Pontimonas salivibrio TaxID=1159327 RepID=A0A2L2BR25_9MICO|nr:hypothetical protein C3B54_111156 [Pontimonas salivibrio]
MQPTALTHSAKQSRLWVMTVLLIALWLNIVVLVPVIASLAVGAKWTVRAFGQATPARGIVMAQYLAILAASILFLVWPLEPGIITLLAIQIAYKVLSAFTVRVLTNPVVISNLLIAAIQTGLLVLHSMPA